MKSNMKKNLIKLGVMLAATFSLTNCTEEITAPTPDVEKGPYTIYANAPETKTVNDGLSTNWAEGDALNVSHAPTGTLGLSYNTMFTLTDAETGRFDTEYLEGELVVSNDWYALYPYNEKIEYLNKMAETGVYFTLASQVGYTQTQKGNDNMKHIAGENYPMYGVVRESLSEEFPSFKMSHVSSLIEVKVTNNVDDEIVVSSVSFTASEDVVGTYYIDITGDEPAFTGSGSSYVSRVANLAVEDGEPILMGESASFYLAVKPFTAPAGSELTIDVNGTKKTIALDYDVTFAEGKIKTINFDLNKYPELPEAGPVESYLKWATSSSAYTEKADINGGEEKVEVLKLGTSSKSGFATIAVPAGTTKIGFYAVSWKDQPATLAIKDANSVIATVAPQANEGATGNQPYTIVADEEADYYEIELNAAADTECTLFTAGKNKRVIIWGLNCYDEKGIVKPEPEPEPEPEGPVEATVAEFSAAEDGDTVYELSGTITKIYQAYNENFNNISFYIEDSTGEVLIFRMSCEGIEDPTAISVGDEITVQGTKTTYNEAPQMAQGGKCISFTDNGKPEEPEVGETQEVTVAEFIAAEVSDVAVYRLTGEIISIAETNLQYHNMNLTIEDETGSVYVYRLNSGLDETYIETLGLTIGDILTIEGNRGEYNGSPQMVNPKYVTHEDVVLDVPTPVYTILFGAAYNGTSVSSYENEWEVTTDNFTVTMVNWNNNKNGWSYVKAGRKNNASVATITTGIVSEEITSVVLGVDNILSVDKINSLKLYVSADPDFADADTYTATPTVGQVKFEIESPAAERYYRIEVDCEAHGNKNGIIQVSRVEFYAD